MYSAEDSIPNCLARVEMNRLPVGESFTVSSSMSFSAMSGGSLLGSAQVAPIDIRSNLFAPDCAEGFPVDSDGELFATVFPVSDVDEMLFGRAAANGELFAPVWVHRHEELFEVHGAMITEQLIECNNYIGNSQAVTDMAQYVMDIKDIRLSRLRELIRDKFDGKSGQCADALGMKRPQMTRWVTQNPKARQGISEESAREIECKLNLGEKWMDSLHAKTEEAIEAADILSTMDKSDQVEILHWLRFEAIRRRHGKTS